MSHEAQLSSINSTNVRNRAPSPLRSCFGLASRISPRLAGQAAARLFCWTHGPRRNNAREQRWLQDAVSFELEFEGRPLAAWSWGDGPTVLLHHGWNGRGAQLGAFIAPLLEKGFSVVTYDAPAHGASPGRLTNGVELARCLTHVSHSVGGLHGIVAHSLGCLVTAYAMRQAMEVERLVFVSPPADMCTFTREFSAAVDLSTEAHDRMLQYFERSLHLDWQDFETENQAAADRRNRGGQTPVLVVHDRNDKQVPWQHGQRVHHAWQGSQLLETRKLGHQRILRDPEVVQRVVGFLENQESS